MKTGKDPRHTNRQKIVQDLFAESFTRQNELHEKAVQILKESEEIDKTIEKIAPEFPVDKLNRVDLSILRLAVYELKVEKKEPPKVIIDEAIELAKEFGGEKSPSFINGALGQLLKDENSKI